MLQLEVSSLHASFTPTLDSGSSPSLLISTELKYTWTFNLRETFKCPQLKVATSKQTNITHACAYVMYSWSCMHNADLVVWGLLRFIPITIPVELHITTYMHAIYLLFTWANMIPNFVPILKI